VSDGITDISGIGGGAYLNGFGFFSFSSKKQYCLRMLKQKKQ
jgi:hypothetical protein